MHLYYTETLPRPIITALTSMTHKKLFLDIPASLAYISTEKQGAARIAIVKG